MVKKIKPPKSKPLKDLTVSQIVAAFYFLMTGHEPTQEQIEQIVEQAESVIGKY